MPTAKAKKKAKRKAEIEQVFDPKAQRQAERRLEKYVMELDERSEERESYVQTILKANDESVEEIIGWMVESMEHMQGPPKLTFEGQSYQAIKGEEQLLRKIQNRNFRYIAVRILVALAEWGIKTGDFKLPKRNCARCGKKVK